MKIMKHEWHQVDSMWTFEITDDFIAQVYPDLDEHGIKLKMLSLWSGLMSVEELLDEADEAGVDIDWDHDYDDWWTMRKGGYDVTYDVIDEDKGEDNAE